MPKFKILITKSEIFLDMSQWSDKHFKSRAEATTAYHALIAQQEDEVNKAQQRLNALVENGHIVEVEDE